MLIAVNTRFLIKDKLEGIGWFTYETMKRLTRNHPEHQFLFLFDRDYDQEFIFSENVIPLKVWPPARHPYLWKYWFDYALPQVFKKYKPDLFISTDGFLSLNTKTPTLLVIHDLGFEHYPEHIPGIVSRFYRKYTPLYAKRATRIITVSEFSKNDIIKNYHIDPDKIDVVHNGASDKYIALSEEEKIITRQNISGGENYFVYVGSVHPRKNIKNLLLAYDQLRREKITGNKLLIAGRLAWKTDEVKAVYETMEFKNDIIFAGHLQLNELTRVVASADALVFPSLFEGFGIPVVEARLCGVPVIVSDRTSLPEVAGENAIYFNPDDVEDIKLAIVESIAKRGKYAMNLEDMAKVKEEFNWDHAAEKIYASILVTIKKLSRKDHNFILS
ncbi:MAG: glycosyltransferase family 4 protein [Chitinophagales bacterium]